MTNSIPNEWTPKPFLRELVFLEDLWALWSNDDKMISTMFFNVLCSFFT